jgi:periplasmic protein TonB
MFDLITGHERHVPSRFTLPIVLSTIAQVAAICAVAVVSLTAAATHVPEVPSMLAFVVPAPPPPTPPPPPPPAPRRATPPPKPAPEPRPAPRIEPPVAAPVEEPETPAIADDEGIDFGVPGGIEGGLPGGSLGGVVGGLPAPLPPPPPAPRGPVRIGGQIKAPELLYRVEPNYPPLAVSARLQGLVILEAAVDRSGAVTGVKVLRSSGTTLLDREAELAVRQWRYRPLLLNGTREPFVLTVTLSFHLDEAS